MDNNFLQNELKRTSDWIQFSDKKAGFLAVYYSIIAGYVLNNAEAIFVNGIDYGCLNLVYYVLLLAASLLVITGLVNIFKSVFPNINNKNKSLFFFSSIAGISLGEYAKDMKEISRKDVEMQLLEQIHTNSFIADKKMKSVKLATKLLFFVAPVLVTIFALSNYV